MNDITLISERVVDAIPGQWLDDFFALVGGDNPSEAFLALFEVNEVWQGIAEEAIRATDSPDFIESVRSAMAVSHRLD